MRFVNKPGAGPGVTTVVAVSVLALVGCAPTTENRSTPPSQSATAAPIPMPTESAVAAPTPDLPEAPMSLETNVTISVDGAAVSGVLFDNAAAASLLAQMPLQLEFVDFGGQEKIAGLPAPLVLDGMPEGSGAEPGTIGYYAPDQALVLYYDSVGYYNGIVPVGTFDDVGTIRDAPAFVGVVAAD